MRKSTKYIIACLSLLVSIQGISQNFIKNGSFEGPDGIEVIPPDWEAGCGIMNTPDTQPGWWNVENTPQDGNSYLDLLYKEDGTTESVYQKLENPLPQGSCFLIEIYLAQACQDSLSNLYHFGLNNPGDLIIRGSSDYGCANGQILAKFEQVNNCDWQVYYAVFQAEFEINYIYLEFDKGASTSDDGSVLIDNFILDFTDPFSIKDENVKYDYVVSIETTLEGVDFEWVIDGQIQNEDSSSFMFNVVDNYLVEVSYLSTDSCLIFESWQVNVIPLFPNVITPINNDGINDAFYIKGLVEPAQLTILNRWGESIYKHSNYPNNWKPFQVPSGTYFYAIYLEESQRYYTGSFMIF